MGVKCNGYGEWAWSIYMPKWPPPLHGSVCCFHGNELPIKQRRVVKYSWEDIFGCILEKLGQPEATIMKTEISANEVC